MDNMTVIAHRAAWECHNGPIPNGLCICHKCDNPPCINIEHLFIGAQKDNMADCSIKGRTARNYKIGHFGAGRKLDNIQADLARAAYATGEVDMRQIALVLGVDQSVISRVINAKSYKQKSGLTPMDLPTVLLR